MQDVVARRSIAVLDPIARVKRSKEARREASERGLGGEKGLTAVRYKILNYVANQARPTLFFVFWHDAK